MPAPKSLKLCQLMVDKYYEEDLPMSAIAAQLRCSEKTVSSTLHRYQQGEPLALAGRRGCRHSDRQFTPEVVQMLRELLGLDDALYLDELAILLQQRTGQTYSVAGVHRALKENQISRKKVGSRDFTRPLHRYGQCSGMMWCI